MDTNKLKRFSTEARNILLTGVAQRLDALGFKPDGTAAVKPELLDGGAVFKGEVKSKDFYHQWMSLYRRMQSHSFREVAEEAAYTWFNRLVAIRIMVKNGLIPHVLEYENDEVRIPVIVSEARQGRVPQMDETDQQKLDALLADDALTNEQFALLIVAYCHSNPIIQKCFGGMADYTELLLPGNILKRDGFIDRLNADDYLSDDDYRSPELIGWLYQFYISERKDEVFAKKGKFEADEIPAATQIFTPNWIVKYMVQNTVGRIYLDNNPYSGIREGMKYLVEPDKPSPADAVYKFDDIHDLKVADLACGSGHILNECFDLLYQIYIEEGYSRRQTVEEIFRYNLTGVDIDTRAKQLAMFALLLKACQKDRSFADGHALPRILDMPKEDRLPLPTDSRVAGEIEAVNQTLSDAETLGSIMKFSLSPAAREWVASLADKNEAARLVLALTEKYSVLVMNPPYMGGGNMNELLGKYVKDNYAESKADLFSVFMEVCISRLRQHGKYGMINMQSWMFLSSFESLRKQVLENYSIESMLHLGPRTFDELSGEVVQNTAFVICNDRPDDTEGIYYRLIDGKSCNEKNRLFLSHICGNNDGQKIYYPHVKQKDFEKIPGCPIGYWVSEKMVDHFVATKQIGDFFDVKSGLSTGDNSIFVRFWHEINSLQMYSAKTDDKNARKGYKWFPYSKGGGKRKWYGNKELVVNYENDANEMKLLGLAVFRNPNYYFREGLTWSGITSSYVSYRYLEAGGIFDSNKGPMIFPKSNTPTLEYALGLLNTKISNIYTQLLNPTASTQIGDVVQIPIDYIDLKASVIEKLTKENITISKQDWDAHETSWEFETNPLLAIDNKPGSLKERIEQYKQKWERLFYQLHANEEELNRQFIDIYGLQDELTPDVPLEEITILQQGEISINDGQIVWHDDVIVKQLISYAVGCMMGRYSLDRKGLVLANQGDGVKEYAEQVPESRFQIDDDGIIPLMSVNNELTDRITLRFKNWLGVSFGEENLMDNLNFVEHALNQRLEDYFLKDFWKDHKRMYQNRPIYWLFSSRKGAFQCIVYMHRMNPYTAERVRTKYLLPHIEWLINRQAELQANAANLSARERREMDNIGKQIDDCREYHDRLHVVADRQIAFDLDDGVLVNYAKFGDVLRSIK